MLFNSLEFLIFFPIVLAVYFFVPKRGRYLWLLVASYYFYMCWNAKYAVLILFSTAVTYLGGLLISGVNAANIDAAKKNRLRKLCVAGSFIINLSILFFFKYFDFAVNSLANAFALLGVELNRPHFDVILPVGISFYTFQALGYTVDVYRGEVQAEKNFLKYALFVSFFPQLVAGPIERSKNLLNQLAQMEKPSYEKMRDGFLLMLWGFFLKLVLADRIAMFVSSIYGNIYSYSGMYFVVATLLFAVQIYCDFAGYSTIAMGAAEMLGIALMENFDAPYLSRSVAEFWRRWHISLSSWFKDYLYIPLGGSRRGKLWKYVNIMIVFLVSGLWHGAKWSFVAWGGINGLYQVIGDMLKPAREWLCRGLRIKTDSIGYRLVQTVVTFLLIDFAWIFFRANGLSEAIRIIHSIFTDFNPWVLTDGSLFDCGLLRPEFTLMLCSIGVLLFADILKYKGVKVREVICTQDWLLRCLTISGAVLLILLFGVWGPTYFESSFIYFQF